MINLDPTIKGLSFTVKHAQTRIDTPIRYAGLLEYHIRRKGCQGEPELKFSCIDEKWPDVTVLFDQRAYKLERGYYEGFLKIGCDETCKQSFFVGHFFCMESNIITQEAGCTPFNPNCDTDTCATQGHDSPPQQMVYTPIVKHKKSGRITLLVSTECDKLDTSCQEC